jgi:hypothetical protein
MVKLATSGIRSPEAARRLGIDGVDVYRMLFAGQLDGGPGKDGVVYFDEASIDAYLERHGFGVVAQPSAGSSESKPRGATPSSTGDSPKPSSDVQTETHADRSAGGDAHPLTGG